MKKFMFIITTVLFMTFSGNVVAQDTVVDIAVGNEDFSTLVTALKAADLVGALNSEGPFTVFAPTNTAFADLLLELDPSGNTALGDLDPALVDAVLLQHIVAANVQSSELPNGTVTTLGGPITADNTAFTLTDANDRVCGIVTSLVDIQAANGVVHVLDKVILPLL